MKKTDTSLSKILLHIALGLGVAGLGLDIYLRMTGGTGICSTQACAIVGDYVRISEFSLVLLGLIFFTALWVNYVFALKYASKWLWTGMSILILGALAFDGGLLGFQYFSIKEHCQLCFGVGGALLLVLALFSLVRKRLAVLLLGLAIWIGGGMAGAVINIPERAPLLEHISGITVQDSEDSPWPRFYYFFSLHCPHCTDILTKLAEQEPESHTWELMPLDKSQTDLKKIAWIMEQDAREKNIFYEIVSTEQSREVPEIKVPDNLSNKIDRIRSYFRANGFRGVPLMIVEENQGKRLILTGGGNILNYLHDQGILER